MLQFSNTKKIITFGLLYCITISGILIGQNENTHAFTSTVAVNNTNSQSVQTGNPEVPKGAMKVDGIFAKPHIETKNGGSVGNTGVIDGPKNQNNGVPFSEIVLSGKHNAVSIWSNETYKMDFSKSFSGRTYVNFGTNEADGFAFVMHNDPKRTSALTSALSSKDGQNLGVYGSTSATYSIWSGVTTPESTAIKNSVAVEFDLYQNISAPSMFDKNVPLTPHMAYSFPGNLESYTPYKGYWYKWQLIGHDLSDAIINHQNPQVLNGSISNTVKDGTWYEFRYDFNATTKNFTYYLKNPLTGQETIPVLIPWNKLSKELQLSMHGNQAYWGFTAANGEASGQVKFVFTQVPIDLDTVLNNDVLFNNNSIIDHNDTDNYEQGSPTAEPQKEITIKSQFTVTEGEANLSINDWTTIFGNNIIDFSKPLTNIQATINNQVFKGQATIDSNTGTIHTIFPNLTVAPGNSIDFQYNATVSNIDSTKKAYISSSLQATELGNNTAVPLVFSNPTPFWIYKNHPTELSWGNDNLTKNENLDKSEIDKTGYHGSFLWQDIDKNDKLRFYIKKGNDVIQKIDQVVTNKEIAFQEQVFNIPNEKISYNNNRFTVEAYRIDTYSNEIKESKSLILNLNITGKLAFQSAPTTLKWTNHSSSETKAILNRDMGNPIEISILDSRENQHPWYVGISMKKNKNTPFNLVWKATNSSKYQSITNKPLPIMNSTDITINNYTYTKKWNESEGVLLKSDEYLHVGDYSEKIKVEWHLYDTEIPE